MQLSCNPNLEKLENFVCVEGWGVWSPINTKTSVSFLNGGNYHRTIKSLEAEGRQEMSHHVEQQQVTRSPSGQGHGGPGSCAVYNLHDRIY